MKQEIMITHDFLTLGGAQQNMVPYRRFQTQSSFKRVNYDSITVQNTLIISNYPLIFILLKAKNDKMKDDKYQIQRKNKSIEFITIVYQTKLLIFLFRSFSFWKRLLKWNVAMCPFRWSTL